MRKTYLYGLLTGVRIKKHLPLESPFNYFIQIVINLRIVSWKFRFEKVSFLTFEKSDASSRNIFHIDSITLGKSLI